MLFVCTTTHGFLTYSHNATHATMLYENHYFISKSSLSPYIHILLAFMRH